MSTKFEENVPAATSETAEQSSSQIESAILEQIFSMSKSSFSRTYQVNLHPVS